MDERLEFRIESPGMVDDPILQINTTNVNKIDISCICKMLHVNDLNYMDLQKMINLHTQYDDQHHWNHCDKDRINKIINYLKDYDTFEHSQHIFRQFVD
jgi:hypothetical protein